MADADGTCEYVLDSDDPETWGGEEGEYCRVKDDVLNDDGVWDCPHGAIEGERLCIFHLPIAKKDADKTNDAVKQTLEKLSKRDSVGIQRKKSQFIGAKFDYLDIEDVNLEGLGDNIIDFSYSRFKGDISSSSQTFLSEINFIKVKIGGKVDFSHSTFKSETSFSHTKFGDKVAFEYAVFDDSVTFWRSEFEKEAQFWLIKFRNGVVFSETVFKHFPAFWDSEFNQASFEDAKFQWGVSFDDAEFERVNFRKAKFDGNFADFNNVRFRDEADFSSKYGTVHFDTDTTFINSELNNVDFSYTNLSRVDFERANLIRCNFFESNLSGTALYGVVTGGVHINEGTNFGDRCVYDPKFDDVPAADIESSGTYRLTKAAGQYRLIEQMARTNAFPDILSHNFIRRKDMHREQHREEGRWGRWIQATASKYVLEYGENPWRLIATGIITVVTFGLLYPLVGGLQPTGGSTITLSRTINNPVLLLQSIYYSTLTFTTLGMGDFLPVGLGRVLTTLETSLGAIIIALLVFVFGRRAAR